jgi:putative endonuclease
MVYFIYILECSNAAFYTGYTTDIDRRYQEHLEGSAKSKFTRSFPPKRIAAAWKFDTSLSCVLKLEHAIKALTKSKKKALVDNPKSIYQLLNNGEEDVQLLDIS